MTTGDLIDTTLLYATQLACASPAHTSTAVAIELIRRAANTGQIAALVELMRGWELGLADRGTSPLPTTDAIANTLAGMLASEGIPEVQVLSLAI